MCARRLEVRADTASRFKRMSAMQAGLQHHGQFSRFCVLHQEKLQGKVGARVEFATTASGMFAYSKWLWKVPLVFTANYTTRNLDLLQRNDFLGRPENRVLIELSGPLLP